MSKSLLYFADPMCSWCWGFAPVIRAVHSRYRDRLPMQLFMGGLQPGTTTPLSADSAAEIRQHWQHVETASAQTFNFTFFERREFVYDTEPASRAVIAVLRIDSSRGLDFLSHLQQAFYAANSDITATSELVRLAVEFGLEQQHFRRLLADDETRRITNLSFAYARHLGISGFPTLIAQDQACQVHEIITRGYQPLEAITHSIDRWLDQSA